LLVILVSPDSALGGTVPHAHGGLVDEDCHRGMHTAYSGIQVPTLEPSRIKYGSLYRDKTGRGI